MIHDVAHCTLLYHLRRRQWWIDEMSPMPSFYSGDAKDVTSLSLMPQIQWIMVCSLRRSRHGSWSFGSHDLISWTIPERTQNNVGQYAHGRLTPRYFMPHFKIMPADSPNYIIYWPRIRYSCSVCSTISQIVMALWCIEFQVYSAIKIASLWHNSNWQSCWVKYPHAWAVCPHAVGDVLLRGYIYFFFSMYTNSYTYQ